MCGEETSPDGERITRPGSPPHVRGRAAHHRGRVLHRGITPACAGKSGRPVDLSGALRDHPRACGEEAKIFRAECGPTGSPPRVRGRVADQLTSRELLGITPARAGKRDSSDKRKGNTTDHPRACGEESPSLRRSIASRGSPPRVRGRVLAQLLVAPLQRITPARAGKRGSSGQASRPPRITPAYAGKSPSTLVTEFCA